MCRLLKDEEGGLPAEVLFVNVAVAERDEASLPPSLVRVAGRVVLVDGFRLCRTPLPRGRGRPCRPRSKVGRVHSPRSGMPLSTGGEVGYGGSRNEMDFRVLGPLEVRSERGAVHLGGPKPRAVLAVLLLHANEPVSSERLVAAVWGEEESYENRKSLQVSVSRLRKALGEPGIVATKGKSYEVRVRPGELDAERFERLVDDGRHALAAGHAEEAAASLREGLALWRGPALADLAVESFAETDIARLEEQRLAALETRVDADLAAGQQAALVGELRQLVADNPTRERLAGQLMLALYR